MHGVHLAPKSDKAVMCISGLKMNKLSTYKLCIYNCPGLTGCVLHAACKYLSLIIFQKLTATTASDFSSLPPLPPSYYLQSSAAVAMTTEMKSLGTLSLPMGISFPIRTLLYASQTGLAWRLCFKYTIKSCGNWDSRSKIMMVFSQGPRNLQILLSTSHFFL